MRMGKRNKGGKLESTVYACMEITMELITLIMIKKLIKIFIASMTAHS
jgi:hypothetical protein